jgi:hypothetical protein
VLGFLIALFGLSLKTATTFAAGEVVSIELADVAFIGCTGAIFEGSYRIVMKDVDGAVVNATTPITNRRIYTTDNGVTLYSDARRADQVISFGEGLPGAAITYGTIRVELGDDPSVSSATYVFDCATLTITLIYGGGDDRLNPNTGDLLIALYARTDDEGKPSIHVYQIDANSKGVFIGQFANSDFEPYLTKPPAKNTKIASIGKATLYVLASGEFQIVIGLDAEGKQYSVIFKGLPPRNIRLMSALN